MTKQMYFNPGAVGLNNGSHAVYGIVTVTDTDISLERVKLAYDNEEFLEGFEAKQVPAKELIFENLCIKSCPIIRLMEQLFILMMMNASTKCCFVMIMICCF